MIDGSPSACSGISSVQARRCHRRFGGAVGPSRQPEVEDLRVPLRRDDDVVGFDAAVDDASGMSVGESVGDLHRELEGAARIHRAAAHLGCQRLASDELANEIQLPLIVVHLVQRCDIRVREDESRARRLEKPLTPLRRRP